MKRFINSAIFLAYIFSCGPNIALDLNSKLVYQFKNEIYLTDGFGNAPKKVLPQKYRKQFDRMPLYDSYFHPSLSPKEDQIAAIRITNYGDQMGSPKR